MTGRLKYRCCCCHSRMRCARGHSILSLRGTSGAGRRARRVQDLQVWGRAGGGESEGGGGAGRRAKGPWGGAKRLTGCGWGGGRGAGKSEAGLAGGSSGSRGKGNPANKAEVVGADALNKSRSMMHHACSLSAVPLHTSPLTPRTSGWRCSTARPSPPHRATQCRTAAHITIVTILYRLPVRFVIQGTPNRA